MNSGYRPSGRENLFPTIYGRNLIGELRHFVHRHALASFVTSNGLPYTVTNEAQITDRFIERARQHIEATFGP